ncbi:hydroxyisourate hydrolase [Cellulomonas flavigena DSM 20109]|uniref:5-hydroxyisourate hydrolase n=1 Tax=Cellulomonas flavigena (strain ATCC 482 / DSM 20109 / BCRC 11376 / JCM 18109 / NBRC 3775 / NCIMB 8073 / NRS 134) TaxID=446466 RepID=D5UJM9_CELFN|nr:hydroxyisourate hydrolase [Cellulomonas flavigena]ADG75667.1 hydroxyisourate hydrolase [Cellulomonas flavigena DSM 20109]
MTSCSTHVLDAAAGRPAAGLDVALLAADGTVLERGRTDDDGRLRWDTTLTTGTYGLRFATAAWFAAAGVATVHAAVHLEVLVDGSQPHYHLALLLSPFAYTTYRGS